MLFHNAIHEIINCAQDHARGNKAGIFVVMMLLR